MPTRPSRPAPTAFRTSRSVRMPTSRPSSRTSTAPTPRAAIRAAASPSFALGSTARTSRVITAAIEGMGDLTAALEKLRGGLGLGIARLDRIVSGVPAPLEPAAVVDGNPRPAHQVGVKPGLACSPAGPAIEGDPLGGADAGLLPVGRDLRVGPHRVVDVAVVLHVVGVGATVPPNVAGDAAGWADVVVAADLADVLLPGPDADEERVLPVAHDVLGLVDVDDDLRAQRDPDTERRDRRRLPDDLLDRVTRL